MNAQIQNVPVFQNRTGTITLDACVYRGVSLDRMVDVGPRGGKCVSWRAASKRDYQMASWSATKQDAAK